ncbi:MAG: 2,3-bisphosphoglycerate-independent phosphoglycerate mutase [Patescibacteria group bacterium]
MADQRRPVVMLVLDGWGISPISEGNAIASAQTPNIHRLLQEYPSMALQAAGTAVGLPWGEAGNSEVGHLNLGAGRIVFQEVPAIATALASGSFFQNQVFIDAVKHVKEHESALHFIGVLSPEEGSQGLEHVKALLELSKQQDFKDVYLHLLLDKEGQVEDSMGKYLKQLQAIMQQVGVGKIATVSGEYYAMDREKRWEHTARAYSLMVDGKGPQVQSVDDVLARARTKDMPTEYVEPTRVDTPRSISDNDSIIFFNYRPERSRQLAKAFVAPYFGQFEHGEPLKNLYLVTMSSFADDMTVKAAFVAEKIKDSLGEAVAKTGLKQYHVAETEKFAHITTFLNGGHDQAFKGETDEKVPSPEVRGYDERPEMAAATIADKLLAAMRTNDYALYVANFANMDMVGHTGNFEAAIRGAEAVDKEVGRITEACQKSECNLVITADHGNAEQMTSVRTGISNVDHSNNPVPFVLVSPDGLALSGQDRSVMDGSLPSGMLADVAPTVLDLLQIPKPEAMTGYSLIERPEGQFFA